MIESKIVAATVRFVFTALLVYGAYREAGICTAISFALIWIGFEGVALRFRKERAETPEGLAEASEPTVLPEGMGVELR